MSWTFGAATSDRLDGGTSFFNIGGGTSLQLGMGWIYPTTLTSGRGLWTVNNKTGVVINATTSELTLSNDRVTTDSSAPTSGAGITTNKWWFVAALIQIGSTGIGVRRCWIGDEFSPPAAIGFGSSTAGTAGTATSTSQRIGNVSSGTGAFQGDIGNVLFINQLVDLTNPVGTSATIGTREDGGMLSDWVVPCWAGTLNMPELSGGLFTSPIEIMYVDLEAPPTSSGVPFYRVATQTSGTPVDPGGFFTVTGATYSQRKSPRPLLMPYPLLRAARRH